MRQDVNSLCTRIRDNYAVVSCKRLIAIRDFALSYHSEVGLLRLRLSVCVSLGVSEHLAMCESHVSSSILSTFLATYCTVCSQADCSLQRSRWSATVGGCYLLCIVVIRNANKRVFKESLNRTRTHQEMRQRTWTFVRRQHSCRRQRLRPLNRLANFYYKYLW